MLQINEQICSDNYDIDVSTLMPKPTLSCGADGQPENLDFQFYEDRKCDGVQDCENGFDESDCGMMDTVDVPKMDENGPIEDDDVPVACCKYLRFERTFCHHIQLDFNHFGGALDAWECNDGLEGRDGSVFFRITGELIVYGKTETKDEWVFNLNGKPDGSVSLRYEKTSETWEKNCPEGGYTSSLNDGYHHLICITEDQFKMNAPCLYKKLNPGSNIGDGIECDVGPDGTDGENADGDGEGANGDSDGSEKPYMPTDDFKKPKEYYNLQVGQFLVRVEMNLALEMEFPEDQGLTLTLTELENMAGEGLLEEVFQVTEELKKSFELTLKDLLDSEEHFVFEISISEGPSPDQTELDITIEYSDPTLAPMADNWQPDSLFNTLLQAAENISNQLSITYELGYLYGNIYHQTSKYLKIFESSYCGLNTSGDYECQIDNIQNIRNEDIEMVNFEQGLENFTPYRNPTIRMLVDVEIELPKDAQIKEALKSKIYEMGNGNMYSGYKPFHEVNPLGSDGYTFFECQDDGVSGTLKTGSAMNLKKTSKRKRRHAENVDTSAETETIVVLIDYITNPENEYESLGIIDDLLSEYDSQKNNFPYIEEHISLEILELIETEFDIYDTILHFHFYIEAPSAVVYDIKEVGLGMTLQENFSPVQFISHYQMLHRVHVEVPTEEVFMEIPSWLKTMVDDMANGKKPDEIENIDSLRFLKSKLIVHDYITTKLVYALPGGSDIDKCKITAVLNAECLVHTNAILLGNEDKTCIQFALECIEEDVLNSLTLDELIDNNIKYQDIQDYLNTDTDPEIISIQRKKSQNKDDPDEWSMSYLYPVGEEETVTFNTVDELLKEYHAPYWFINDGDFTDDSTKYVTRYVVKVEIEVKLREPFTAALIDPSSDEFKKLAANVLPESIEKEFESANPFSGGETIIEVTFTPASEARRRKRRLAADLVVANLEIFYTSNPDVPIEDVVIPNIDDFSSSIIDEAKSALAMSLVVDPTQLENLKIQVDEPIIQCDDCDSPCVTTIDCDDGELCNMDDGESGGLCQPCPGETDQACINSKFIHDLGTAECQSVCVGNDDSDSGTNENQSCDTCTSDQQSGQGLERILRDHSNTDHSRLWTITYGPYLSKYFYNPD